MAKLQKAIKEMQSRIEANEEELEAERQARDGFFKHSSFALRFSPNEGTTWNNLSHVIPLYHVPNVNRSKRSETEINGSALSFLKEGA